MWYLGHGSSPQVVSVYCWKRSGFGWLKTCLCASLPVNSPKLSPAFSPESFHFSFSLSPSLACSRDRLQHEEWECAVIYGDHSGTAGRLFPVLRVIWANHCHDDWWCHSFGCARRVHHCEKEKASVVLKATWICW